MRLYHDFTFNALIAGADRVKRVSDESFLIACPADGHGRGRGDQHPSLSVTRGEDGRILLYCLAGCSIADICRALGIASRDLFPRGSGSGTGILAHHRSASPVARPSEALDTATRLARALRVIAQTHPIRPGGIVDRYLSDTRGRRSRDGTRPDDLREADRLRYPYRARHHAMVGVVRGDDDEVLGVHRTYLAIIGGRVLKLDHADVPSVARVADAKLSLGRIKGGAIRLGPDTDAIVIGEGIESSLGASAATGRTAWASISSSGMRGLILPATIRDVLIAYDRDPGFAGQRAALVLLRRLKRDGVRVELLHPPQGCNDFGDFDAGGPR